MVEFVEFGSLNIDMQVHCPAFPKEKETITGISFKENFGGKGGNQAVSIANLGGKVTILGSLGNDVFGKQYKDYLIYKGIVCEEIRNSELSTGVAFIEVNKEGQNKIIIVPGANYDIDDKYIEAKKDILLKSGYFLFQAEIPFTCNMKAIRFIKKGGSGKIIFDAAPAICFDKEIYQYIDYLTCNETEATTITSIPTEADEQLKANVQWFLDRGVQNVILKIGSAGVCFGNKDGIYICPPFWVNDVVDTTGAGDAFNGAFAFALGQNFNFAEAVWFGQAESSLAIEKYGAQTGLPSFPKVMDRYNSQKCLIRNI